MGTHHEDERSPTQRGRGAADFYTVAEAASLLRVDRRRSIARSVRTPSRRFGCGRGMSSRRRRSTRWPTRPPRPAHASTCRDRAARRMAARWLGRWAVSDEPRRPALARLRASGRRTRRPRRRPDRLLLDLVEQGGTCWWEVMNGDPPSIGDGAMPDRALAARMCAGCPVQRECLELELRTAGAETRACGAGCARSTAAPCTPRGGRAAPERTQQRRHDGGEQR